MGYKLLSCHPSTAKRGHLDSVFSLCCDQNRIYSVCKGGILCEWSHDLTLCSQQELPLLPQAAAFEPRTRTAAFSSKHDLILYHYPSACIIWRWHITSHPIIDISLSSDYLAILSGSRQQQITVLPTYSYPNSSYPSSPLCFKAPPWVRFIKLHPKRPLIAGIGHSGIYLWNFNTGQTDRHLQQVLRPTCNSQSGDLLGIGGLNGSITLFQDYTVAWHHPPPQASSSMINALTVDAKLGLVAYHSLSSNQIALLRTSDGTPLHAMPVDDEISSLVFHYPGNFLLAGTTSGSILQYDPYSTRLTARAPTLKYPVTALAISSDETSIFAAEATEPNAELVRWDALSFKATQVITQDYLSEICHLTYSCQQYLTAISPEGKVLLIPDTTETVTTLQKLNLTGSQGVGLSADGDILVQQEPQGNLIVWDLKRYETVAQLPLRRRSWSVTTTSLFKPFHYLKPAPDKIHIYIAEEGPYIRLWNFLNGKTERIPIPGVSVSPLLMDISHHLLVLWCERRLFILSRHDHKITTSFATGAVCIGKLSSDERHLILGYPRGEVKIYDPKSGTLKAVHRYHRSQITDILPLGSGYLSSSLDGSITLIPDLNSPSSKPKRFYRIPPNKYAIEHDIKGLLPTSV